MKQKVLIAIGMFFVLWGCAAIFKSIYFGNYGQILWACWIGFIILGIGIIRKNDSLVVSQLNILAVPWGIWSIDFIYRFIERRSLWGITDYVFTQSQEIDTLVTMAHIVALPLALYALAWLKPTKMHAWKISLLELAGLLILTTIFTGTGSDNKINCIYGPCIPIEIPLPAPIPWILAVTLLVFGTNYLITKIYQKERNLFNSLNAPSNRAP